MGSLCSSTSNVYYLASYSKLFMPPFTRLSFIHYQDANFHFKLPFPVNHLWKTSLCSLPYYYFLFPILLLSVENSREEFTTPFPLFSPKSLSKLFFTAMPQTPESLHCFVQCKSCFPQYPLLWNYLLLNSDIF